jgi:hypothetical protein
MPKTNAERQADWYQRHRERDKAMLAGNDRLRREVRSLSAALEYANDEIARLSGTACAHPSEAISNGQCAACGEWL